MSSCTSLSASPSYEKHKFLALCDVYGKALASLYRALRAYQGNDYTRLRERYKWTIHSSQHLRSPFATQNAPVYAMLNQPLPRHGRRYPLIPELLDLTRGKDVKKNFHVESCVNLKLRHSLLQSPGGSEAHTGIAFEKLKCAFTVAPVLAHLDPTLETWMETDSSDTVTAGVLSQIQSGGVLRPSRVRRVKIRTVRN
jgi:hypothetical protein